MDSSTTGAERESTDHPLERIFIFGEKENPAGTEGVCRVIFFRVETLRVSRNSIPATTVSQPTEIRKARRWRSRPRSAKGRRATILESEEEAKPPPQRERKDGNGSRKRGGGEAAPAARTQNATKRSSEEAAKPPPQRSKKRPP